MQTKWRESTFSIGLDGIMYETTNGTNTDQTSGINKAVKTINVATTEDNDLEFEDMIAGEKIIFKAGKKNNVKGVTRCYETDTSQTSFRVNAFGIPILKALFNDGFAASLQQFAASDPFVASFMATVSSERLSQAGYRGVITAAEFIRLIDHITSNGTHAKSLKALFAKRLGLSSDGQSFSPTLNFRLGHMNQKQAMCMTTQPTVDANGVELISGEQSAYEGLKFVNTKEITINSGSDLSFTPGNAVSTETSSTDVGASVTYVPGVGITGIGVDASIGNGSSEQHPHIPVLAKKTDITVGGNMKALNYVFGGEIATDDPQMQDKRSEVKITVEKNCIIGTLPDKSYYEQYHGAIFAGLDGQSGSVGAGAAHNEKVAVVAQGGIAHGTKIDIKVKGTLTLNGALIDGEGDIEADELEVNDIYLKDNASATGFEIGYQSVSAVNSQESFTYDRLKKEGIIHTVIGPKINLRIKKGLPANLRRNVNEAREDLTPEETHWNLAFFTLNFDRLSEMGKEWRQMRDDAKGREKLTKEFAEEIRKAQQKVYQQEQKEQAENASKKILRKQDQKSGPEKDQSDKHDDQQKLLALKSKNKKQKEQDAKITVNIVNESGKSKDGSAKDSQQSDKSSGTKTKNTVDLKTGKRKIVVEKSNGEQVEFGIPKTVDKKMKVLLVQALWESAGENPSASQEQQGSIPEVIYPSQFFWSWSDYVDWEFVEQQLLSWPTPI